ncbi:MAG TPA: fumarylacetoacetate hydrolase family protein [Stellaceae bacterium]|nr:fumarylacetoacetate hydrolase family protein [Stellaceae bacterium]
MRIATYTHRGTKSYGAVTAGGIVDLGKRIGQKYPSLLALLEKGGLDEARRAIEGQKPAFPESEIAYLPVIPDRINIYCTGLNYQGHIDETKLEKPKFPRLFMKLDESLVGHKQPMIRPKASIEYDFEGELMAVIGKEARHVSEADAMKYVAGYTLFNDGSLRDFQRRTTDQGKNFYRSSSVGPELVTLDEIPPATEMKLISRLNGKVEQETNIADMIFPVPALLSYFSGISRLRPGDMIATGTCGRVSYSDKQFMKAGDTIEIEITGIGKLVNPIVDEK